MTTRDRNVLAAVLAAALVAAFWFAVLGPKRNEASTLSAKIEQEQARLDAARQRESAAAQARDNYEQDYATVARLGKAVPVQADVPSLVYQIESAAEKHGIDFRALKLDAAPAAGAQTAPPAAQVAGAGAQVKGNDAAGAASPAPGTPVGAAGFPVMPFSFTFEGSFFAMEDFLRALDRMAFARKDTLKVAGRLLTINGVTLSAGREGFPRIQAQVNANAFQLPADEGLTGGASPRPGAQPQPTAGGGPATATATVFGG